MAGACRSACIIPLPWGRLAAPARPNGPFTLKPSVVKAFMAMARVMPRHCLPGTGCTGYARERLFSLMRSSCRMPQLFCFLVRLQHVAHVERRHAVGWLLAATLGGRRTDEALAQMICTHSNRCSQGSWTRNRQLIPTPMSRCNLSQKSESRCYDRLLTQKHQNDMISSTSSALVLASQLAVAKLNGLQL